MCPAFPTPWAAMSHGSITARTLHVFFFCCMYVYVHGSLDFRGTPNFKKDGTGHLQGQERGICRWVEQLIAFPGQVRLWASQREPARLLRMASSYPLGFGIESGRSSICCFGFWGFLNAGVFDGGRFGGGCFSGLFGRFGSLLFVGFGAVNGTGFVVACTCCDHDWRKCNVCWFLTRS